MGKKLGVLYSELKKEWMQELDRTLTTKEKDFILWMAKRQKNGEIIRSYPYIEHS
ncbi:MAG TPA: hypothetical protein VFK33_00795 [Bacillales bacterium]|nr:hypothetical protein [Bacillales bacterium]